MHSWPGISSASWPHFTGFKGGDMPGSSPASEKIHRDVQPAVTGVRRPLHNPYDAVAACSPSPGSAVVILRGGLRRLPQRFQNSRFTSGGSGYLGSYQATPVRCRTGPGTPTPMLSSSPLAQASSQSSFRSLSRPAAWALRLPVLLKDHHTSGIMLRVDGVLSVQSARLQAVPPPVPGF